LIDIHQSRKESLMNMGLRAAFALTGALIAAGFNSTANAGIATISTASCLNGQPATMTAQTYNTSPADGTVYASMGAQGDFFGPDSTIFSPWADTPVIQYELWVVAWVYQDPTPIYGYYSVSGFHRALLRGATTPLTLTGTGADCFHN